MVRVKEDRIADWIKLGLAAAVGVLAGAVLFPRKAHGPGRPINPPEPRATPEEPSG